MKNNECWGCGWSASQLRPRLPVEKFTNRVPARWKFVKILQAFERRGVLVWLQMWSTRSTSTIINTRFGYKTLVTKRSENNNNNILGALLSSYFNPLYLSAYDHKIFRLPLPAMYPALPMHKYRQITREINRSSFNLYRLHSPLAEGQLLHPESIMTVFIGNNSRSQLRFLVSDWWHSHSLNWQPPSQRYT